MAQLVTLSGGYEIAGQETFVCCDYTPRSNNRRSRVRSRANAQEELMAGWWTDLKRSSVGRAITSVTHDTPVGYLWRPSKTSGWMAPVGGALMGVGTALSATGVGAVVGVPLLAVGGGMTVVGGVGEAYHAEQEEKKMKKAIATAQEQKAVKEAKTNKMLWIGAAGLGALGLYMALK